MKSSLHDFFKHCETLIINHSHLTFCIADNSNIKTFTYSADIINNKIIYTSLNKHICGDLFWLAKFIAKYCQLNYIKYIAFVLRTDKPYILRHFFLSYIRNGLWEINKITPEEAENNNNTDSFTGAPLDLEPNVFYA